jgi:hypothetical protein
LLLHFLLKLIIIIFCAFEYNTLSPGKTIQTLGFLAKLKESGFSGPHLIVTPLAVLQNWHNEVFLSLSLLSIHSPIALGSNLNIIFRRGDSFQT